MNWNIVMTWNGTEVMRGKCSAVVAFETARAHAVGNFAGLKHKAWRESAWTPEIFTAMLEKGEMAGAWKDETGSATWTLWKDA